MMIEKSIVRRLDSYFSTNFVGFSFFFLFFMAQFFLPCLLTWLAGIRSPGWKISEGNIFEDELFCLAFKKDFQFFYIVWALRF